MTDSSSIFSTWKLTLESGGFKAGITIKNFRRYKSPDVEQYRENMTQ
jgi:hypothetical protein